NHAARVRSTAYLRVQNAVYGQILVGVMPLYTDKRLMYTARTSYKAMTERLLRSIELTMDEPDAGLWEFRNVKQVHTYTMLFHWAGSKAAMRIGQMMTDGDLVARAERL